MKVKTKCPKCDNIFITEVPESQDSFETTCPSCRESFKIKKKCLSDPLDEECSWEEHGEPRKTVLSSLKPYTNRPMVASFLLLTTAVLGVFTAVVIYTNDLTVPIFSESMAMLTASMRIELVFALVIIFSVAAFLGFLFSWRRRHFSPSAVCAFLGILSIGFFIGSVLSTIALILIITAREEFENGKQGKIF